MIGKMKPITITAEANATLQKQLGVQEVARSAPKSTDPINYPVFSTLLNKKALIYVPNHVVKDAQGKEVLRADRPLIHPVTDGKRFYSFRCIAGLNVPELGLNGECPLCDGTSEPWELANMIIENKCKDAGLDPEDTDNDLVKGIRSAAFSDRVIKDTTRYLTFPIVVFETVNDDGKTLVKDEQGNLKYKTYWYNISESQYQEKWEKTLDAMEDEPTHPGGCFFVLDYTYTPKKGEPNRRDSARNMQVNPRNIKGSEQLRKMLDEQTEGWTPEKAQETVISNQIYSVDALQKIEDEALEPTRNLLIMYKSPVSAVEGNAFGHLEKKPEVPKDSTQGIPLDDIDEE